VFDLFDEVPQKQRGDPIIAGSEQCRIVVEHQFEHGVKVASKSAVYATRYLSGVSPVVDFNGESFPGDGWLVKR
jgi:hypothetical protein